MQIYTCVEQGQQAADTIPEVFFYWDVKRPCVSLHAVYCILSYDEISVVLGISEIFVRECQLCYVDLI